MDTSAQEKQGQDCVEGRWAPPEHHRLFHLRQPPSQVEIILQAVKCEDAIKIAPGQVSRQAGGCAACSDEQVIIAKAAHTRKTDIFSLCGDLLNASIDDMNRLSTLSTCRISE